MNYHKIILIGNATGDWGRRRSKKDNAAYTVFRLQVNAGPGQPARIPILAFGELAEQAAEGLEKGLPLLVEGRLHADRHDQWSVIADKLIFEVPFKENA